MGLKSELERPESPASMKYPDIVSPNHEPITSYLLRHNGLIFFEASIFAFSGPYFLVENLFPSLLVKGFCRVLCI